jgi:hypothetical protein
MVRDDHIVRVDEFHNRISRYLVAYLSVSAYCLARKTGFNR